MAIASLRMTDVTHGSETTSDKATGDRAVGSSTTDVMMTGDTGDSGTTSGGTTFA